VVAMKSQSLVVWLLLSLAPRFSEVNFDGSLVLRRFNGLG
jgi:hypothetical protein